MKDYIRRIFKISLRIFKDITDTVNQYNDCNKELVYRYLRNDVLEMNLQKTKAVTAQNMGNRQQTDQEEIIMAILVTGGAGYIGSHTVVELQNA